MRLYLSIIGVAMAVIALCNTLFGAASLGYAVAAVVWCTALQFLLDGGVAMAVHVMPNRWFLENNPLYRVSERERMVYKKWRVRSWKDKVWELGGLGGFSKRELKEPNSLEYIERFIVECNKGVLTHVLSCPIGFLAMLTARGVCAFTIALPVAVVNLFLNVLPIIVLRYNTPTLIAQANRLRRRTR